MNSASLFQLLYQNDMLFHLAEDQNAYTVENSAPIKTVAQEPSPVTTVPVVQTETTVVAPPVPQPVQPEIKVTPFPALNHKVLILVDEPEQKEMLASEALFLDNILKAVGHSAANSDILNFSYIAGPDARSVLAEKKVHYFITFGVPLIKLQLDLLLPPYTPKLVEGIWFLLTDPLAVIEADVTLKKKLWAALKQMFPKN